MSAQQAAVRPEGADAAELSDPRLYDNRELSWVDFNARVLELAEQADVPLLERLKFTAIFTSNLDEFFMIRVAGLHDQVEAGLDEPGADGRTPSQILDELRERLLPLCERQSRCLEHEIRPALQEHGIAIVPLGEVGAEDREALDEHFRRQIFPVLTPLAVGVGRPFPYISNLSLSLAMLVRDPQTGVTTFARVKVPKEMLPRFVPAGEASSTRFVTLEE
ncbi:MAG TPA: RNA degradosome polyphosphate kinase, partial [Solirubrobacteraceae bacterium]|nr:RNA degradosome polyphosphate kinase [Solirubrobacteraceae bacterium]